MEPPKICHTLFTRVKETCSDVKGYVYCKQEQVKTEICVAESASMAETLERLKTVLSGIKPNGDKK